MAKLVIAESSHVIALGLLSLVKTFQDVENVRIVHEEEECCSVIEEFSPDILLINTSFLKLETMHRMLKIKKDEAIVVHIFNTPLPIGAPMEQVSILDSKDILLNKFDTILKRVRNLSDELDTEELSPREKDILKEVAIGLTNKEIAEKTFISTHTVISHRKNITRKLGIKTVSGLTVYAILNNIIQMDDIS
ncbi:response regulator transcription factor [Carboxylicivirga sp. M1479]|uniref:response regulator transcription factor n=1 Tax=Carboxylicivirga sp. M1479 TaxID=2594476 RepID=UPI00117815FE|nr:LuxR C-terminal-related transcriptional regulator [Carboxylicivirga sp. M1479]TRX66376.1 response regulator transcription factor [Carboxylicivirga sp. M1479]